MKQAIELGRELRGRLRAVALGFEGVRVDSSDGAFRELGELARRLHEQHAGRSAGEIEGVAEARRLYREFGLDPTRTRPSSEALLRRALRGLELYRVSNVVDAGNLVSLSALLPLGLYDADALVGTTLQIRVGGPGEGYEGIRKGRVNVDGRLCVADAEGACGSPTSDSLRTSIRQGTDSVLCVLFAPFDGDLGRLRAAAERMSEAMATHAGARTSGHVELLGD